MVLKIGGCKRGTEFAQVVIQTAQKYITQNTCRHRNRKCHVLWELIGYVFDRDQMWPAVVPTIPSATSVVGAAGMAKPPRPTKANHQPLRPGLMGTGCCSKGRKSGNEGRVAKSTWTGGWYGASPSCIRKKSTMRCKA